MTMVELFNNFELESVEIISSEKVTVVNSSFPTRVVAENGNFGRIEGFSQILQRESGWTSDITDAIRTPDEFVIYRRAGLVEANVGGRSALIKNDINWFQRDHLGRTNLQRIENGFSPLDTRGQSIELHHIGQNRNSPLAELTVEDHRSPGNSSALHSDRTSDVHRNGDNWNTERRQYWEERAKSDLTQRQAASLRTRMAHGTGMREGLMAARITGVITTVDNVRGVYNGEITVQEAAVNIAVDVGTAAALGYGAGFVSSYVAATASQSAHKVIRTLGSAGLPAAAISFGIASYSSTVSFAQGEISGTEFAHDLGRNATGIAGALAGVKVGGVVAGAPGALIGGVVGYLVAVEAYATVVDVINNGVGALEDRAKAVAETAEDLLNSAIDAGQSVVDFVATNAPEALDTVRTALSDFASNLRVPPISFR